MITEEELRALRDELDSLADYITEYGQEAGFQPEEIESYLLASDVSDVIDWVLGESSIEDFKGEGFLNMGRLYEIANTIERETGQSMRRYDEEITEGPFSAVEDQDESRLIEKSTELYTLAVQADEEAIDKTSKMLERFTGETLEKPLMLYTMAVAAGEEAVDEAIRVLRELSQRQWHH